MDLGFPSSAGSNRNEIDVSVLLQVFWRHKILILAISFAFGLLVTLTSFLLPDIYRAQALVTQQNRNQASGISALAEQYGGLAALAGIGLPSSQGNELQVGLEILKSRRFITDFIERYGLLVPLMAAEGWRNTTDELVIDSGLYDEATGTWVRRPRLPHGSIPTNQEAYEEFSDILSVEHDEKTGLVRISIDHISPTIAKTWVDLLIRDLNSEILHREMRNAEQAIKYLKGQLNNTALTGLRDMLFRLIEEQTKIIMLAEISDEYLLVTIDPAYVPEEKHQPNRVLIGILGIVVGGLIALFFVVVRDRNSLRPAEQRKNT